MTVTFTKHGDWSAFSGPTYTIAEEQTVSIIGGFFQRHQGGHGRGLKTRCYSVFCGGAEVGTATRLAKAKEIAKRAVASVGFRTVRQADGTLAVLDRGGVKQFEAVSNYVIQSRFPASVLVTNS
jgi:hypothetical protein